jgi:hypothetical protein
MKRKTVREQLEPYLNRAGLDVASLRRSFAARDRLKAQEERDRAAKRERK